MKTSAGGALLLLGVAVIGGLFWAVWSGMQVELAATKLTADVAVNSVPEVAIVASQLGGWAIKSVFGIVGLAVATGLVQVVRGWLRNQQLSRRRWQPGPNAYWQQPQPKAPRPMSQAEMFSLYMQQQMLHGMTSRPRPQLPPSPPQANSDVDEPFFG